MSPTGRPLKSLSIPKGKWFHSEYFSYIGVCKEWTLKPSVLGLCDPDDDLAVMAAYVEASSSMISFEQEYNQKMSAAKKPGGRRGSSRY